MTSFVPETQPLLPDPPVFEDEPLLHNPSRELDDTTTPETAVTGRHLTWSSTYILIISRVIGSGIFATPGTIVRAVGSPGLALLLWIVGAIIASFGLSIALEFGTMLPRSGGEKVYLEFVYRRPKFLISTIVGVYFILLGFTATNTIIFSHYMLFALGYNEASEFVRKGLAAGLLTIVVLLHAIVPGLGVRIQNFLGWLKIGIVGFMIVSGLWVVLFSDRQSDLSITNINHSVDMWKADSFWSDLFSGSVWNWGIVSTSLFKVFYSYAGLESANNVVNEIQNPIRTLRSATITALITCCLLYLLTNVAYFIVVPLSEIKESGEMIAALFFSRVYGSTLGQILLPLAIALSAGGNVMVVAFTMARLKQEIARQGFLPYGEFFSTTKPFGSPLGALIIHWIPSILVITTPPSERVYDFVLEVEGYPAQIFAFAVAVGLLVLRKQNPDLKRPFKAWIPGVWLRIILSLALLTAPFFPPEEKFKDGIWYAAYAVTSVGILLLAAVYWSIWAVLLPWWHGYELKETIHILSDGTSITQIVRA